jgi:hypothetical protein
MSAQSRTVGGVVPRVPESDRGIQRAGGEHRRGHFAASARSTEEGRQRGGELAGHVEDATPRLSDEEHDAAIRAAMRPLTASQKARLATLLGGGATPTPEVRHDR